MKFSYDINNEEVYYSIGKKLNYDESFYSLDITHLKTRKGLPKGTKLLINGLAFLGGFIISEAILKEQTGGDGIGFFGGMWGATIASFSTHGFFEAMVEIEIEEDNSSMSSTLDFDLLEKFIEISRHNEDDDDPEVS